MKKELINKLNEVYDELECIVNYNLQTLKTINEMTNGTVIEDWKLDETLPFIYMTKTINNGYLAITALNDGSFELERYDEDNVREFAKVFKSLKCAMKSNAWF